MTSLMEADQVEQLRTGMGDLSDTFPFPIVIKRVINTQGAFATTPEVQAFAMTAIREFVSKNEKDQFRNALGPAEAHEFDLFVGWEKLIEFDLINAGGKVKLDDNDLVELEGEDYEIVAFAGVVEIGGVPTFLQLRIKRRWATPQGAEPV